MIFCHAVTAAFHDGVLLHHSLLVAKDELHTIIWSPTNKAE